MKYRVMTMVALAGMIYSCASKSSIPTTEVKKTESTVEVKTGETKSLAGVLTPELAEGKMLYENNCAKCHQLYDTKGFSAEEWKPIVNRMQVKAHLDEIQGLKIYNYVTMKQ